MNIDSIYKFYQNIFGEIDFNSFVIVFIIYVLMSVGVIYMIINMFCIKRKIKKVNNSEPLIEWKL